MSPIKGKVISKSFLIENLLRKYCRILGRASWRSSMAACECACKLRGQVVHVVRMKCFTKASTYADEPWDLQLNEARPCMLASKVNGRSALWTQHGSRSKVLIRVRWSWRGEAHSEAWCIERYCICVWAWHYSSVLWGQRRLRPKLVFKSNE